MTKKLEISRVVIGQAKKLAFFEPIVPTLKKMLINSEDIPMPPFNAVGIEVRSFEEYMFTVCNGVVCDLSKKKKKSKFVQPLHYKCTDCKDTKKVSVYEDCLHCDHIPPNPDCQWCFGKGGIKKLIPCQTCSAKKRDFFPKN